jgi:cytochrome c biogenesis protein CcdA
MTSIIANSAVKNPLMIAQGLWFVGALLIVVSPVLYGLLSTFLTVAKSDYIFNIVAGAGYASLGMGFVAFVAHLASTFFAKK